jgi:hypothetical protein
MIFRAVFWIGLVSLLMPHEPNLGFGRPHMGALSPTGFNSLDSTGTTPGVGACKGSAETCGGELSLLASLQSVAIRSLAKVKADIEESRHAPVSTARTAKILP